MILLAALLVGDAWTWDVTLRYDTRDESGILVERERWTVRVDSDATLAAERRYLGSVVDGATIAASDAKPEVVKGTIARDGSLTLQSPWSDPAAAKLFDRLLRPDRALANRVPGWPIVRKGEIDGVTVHLPGSDLFADVSARVALTSARLGGRDIRIDPVSEKGDHADFRSVP